MIHLKALIAHVLSGGLDADSGGGDRGEGKFLTGHRTLGRQQDAAVATVQPIDFR